MYVTGRVINNERDNDLRNLARVVPDGCRGETLALRCFAG